MRPLLRKHLDFVAVGVAQTVSKEGEVQTPLPAREFDGLSHEGVEAYWQQLQLQVSQWVQEERQMTWAMGSDPQPSHFFSPHSEDSDGAQQSEREGSAGPRNPEEAGASSRWRVCLWLLPPVFFRRLWSARVLTHDESQLCTGVPAYRPSRRGRQRRAR